MFRAVNFDGAYANYFYDALGRRRLKEHPTTERQEFYYSLDHRLLADVGTDQLPTDEYVWLGGSPVAIIRLPAMEGHDIYGGVLREGLFREPCPRESGENCGVYFPVVDHVGKPVAMLDSLGRLAGATDYDVYGEVNRVAFVAETAHPYADDPGNFTPLGAFRQPAESGIRVDWRASVYALSTGTDDRLVFRDPDHGQELSSHTSSKEIAHSKTPWAEQPELGVYVQLEQEASNGTEQPWGVAIDAYEYRRYETGASPFATPLRFPGQYHDRETHLYENWNRYYDPSSGRYWQPEPMLRNPRYVEAMARRGFVVPTYAYTLNNPLKFIDPTGLAVQNNSSSPVVVKIDADPTNSKVVILPPGETYPGDQDGVYTETGTIKTVDGTHAIVNPDGTVEVLTTGAKQTAAQALLGGEVSDAWLDEKKWPPGKEQRKRIRDAKDRAKCQ